MRIFVLVMIAAMMLATSAGAATELLLNPGFTDWHRQTTNGAFGAADIWQAYSSLGTVAPSQGSSWSGVPILPLHDGSTAWDTGPAIPGMPDPGWDALSVQPIQCQRLKLDTKEVALYERGGLRQEFATVAGQQYTVSAWFCTRKSGTDVNPVEGRLAVEDGSALLPGPNALWSDPVWGDSAWEQRTLQVTAAGSVMTIFLDGVRSQGTAGTNNVSVFFDDASASLVPEPGSLIALMSGLVGLVGFGIRRRR
jgi:hypothetical protein